MATERIWGKKDWAWSRLIGLSDSTLGKDEGIGANQDGQGGLT